LSMPRSVALSCCRCMSRLDSSGWPTRSHWSRPASRCCAAPPNTSSSSSAKAASIALAWCRRVFCARLACRPKMPLLMCVLLEACRPSGAARRRSRWCSSSTRRGRTTSFSRCWVPLWIFPLLCLNAAKAPNRLPAPLLLLLPLLSRRPLLLRCP